MKRSTRFAMMALLGIGLAGCATEPQSPEARDDLRDDVQATLNKFHRRDPSLQEVLNRAEGYAVFPNVGKGGVIGGGAYGRGIVFRKGREMGFADITEATVGAQVGGQSFSEMVVFQDPDAMARFMNDEFSFDVNASAVALRAGAAANVNFERGVAVFTTKQSGLMAEAAVGGQRFRFVPRDGMNRDMYETTYRDPSRDSSMSERSQDAAYREMPEGQQKTTVREEYRRTETTSPRY